MMRLDAKLFVLAALLSVDAQATCTNCHSAYTESLKESPHVNLHKSADASAGCVTCHGEGQDHSGNPAAKDITTFSQESATDKNAVCSSCHSKSHSSSQDGHLRFGVACSDCHQIHSEFRSDSPLADTAQLEFGSAVCVACHEDVRATFSFNKRHRLEDNSVTCVSCHDPHATQLPVTLGAASEQSCIKCHADKDGPFVFEHAAGRVEGCIACHAPHGSANRHLLTHQSVGEQCYSCHAEVAQFHLGFSTSGPPRFGTNTVCTNCHSTIHGSNLDPDFLK